MENLKERAIKSVFWVGSARFLSQASSWIITLALVRILSPLDFGLFAMATVYTFLIQIVYDLNFGSAILQKKDMTEEELSSCFWFILFLSIFFYSFTWFFSTLVADFFQNTRLILILRIMGLALVLQSIYLVPYWLLARRLDFNKRAKAELFSSFACQAVVIVAAILGFGVWALIFRFVARELFLLVSLYSFFPWKPSLFFNFKTLQPLLRFGLSVTGFSISRYLSEKLDRMIIGRTLGGLPLGHYSVAMELSRMPISKVIEIINRVSFPVFAKLQNNFTELGRYFLKVTRLISIFALPILSGAIVTTEQLVHVFLGIDWLPLVFVLQVMCAVAIPQCIVGTITALNNARGKPSVNFAFSVALGVIMIPAILLCVKFGINGVAMSWLIVYPCLFLYLLYRTAREIGLSLRLFLENILDPVLASVIMVSVVHVAKTYFLYNRTPFLTLILFLAIGASTYVAYYWFFSRDTFREIVSIGQSAGLSRLTGFFGAKRAQ